MPGKTLRRSVSDVHRVSVATQLWQRLKCDEWPFLTVSEIYLSSLSIFLGRGEDYYGVFLSNGE
jgi:hypothetical protein